ncbi:DNA/RNA helicase domain-containing protein [Streptomyces rubiginosohelvolus]|uniref:DNA/RNA helicase domain-containing protein n=1 Tax=Streptomyces rubiginosohelvolus TaxID=67362 RepID=UPI003819858A
MSGRPKASGSRHDGRSPRHGGQGLEYHHAGVIIGPGLTWTHGRWTAHPEESHDKELRGLPPEQYLRYALNIYRVLLTRGTHTTRIHSTDRKTQHYLDTLIRPGSGSKC